MNWVPYEHIDNGLTIPGTEVILHPSCKLDQWGTPGGGDNGWWCVSMGFGVPLAYAQGLDYAKELAEGLLRWKEGK